MDKRHSSPRRSISPPRKKRKISDRERDRSKERRRDRSRDRIRERDRHRSRDVERIRDREERRYKRTKERRSHKVTRRCVVFLYLYSLSFRKDSVGNAKYDLLCL